MLFNKNQEKTNIEDTDKASAVITLRKAFLRSVLFAGLALAIVVVATLAWLANNRKVDADGMQMIIDTTSNLVIAAQGSTDFSTSVTLTAPTGLTLAPATHYDSSNSSSFSTVTGTDNDLNLIFNNNPQDVSFSTGLQSGAAGLTYEYVTQYSSSATVNYYYDYVVKLASDGKTFDADELNAVVSYDGTVSSSDWPDHFYAASVDFYIVSGSTATYKGTLNLAADPSSELDLFDGNSTSTTIPLAPDNYITVLMRFYFDGALQRAGASPAEAYVHSENLNPTQMDLKVSFTAVDAAVITP